MCRLVTDPQPSWLVPASRLLRFCALVLVSWARKGLWDPKVLTKQDGPLSIFLGPLSQGCGDPDLP